MSSSPDTPNPPRYTVEFEAKAYKELQRINAKDRRRIAAEIATLADNPRPHGCLRLTGYENRWRIRIGDYRVIYEIYEGELRVLVVRAAHRKDVYD